MIFYSRETFVLFLKLIRQRLRIPSSPWQQIMDRFFEIRDADKSMPMDTYNENDLSAHLHRYGLYTMAYLRPLRKPGLFSKWDSVPMVVRIILSVPRAKLRNVFSGPDVGTPLLQCDIAAHGMQNVFSSLHLAFGKVISVDDARNPRVIIEEDPQGQEGSLPLLVSFIMPSFLLANIPDQEAVNVSFGLRSYPGSLPFVKKLGDMLRIFTGEIAR
ncbi:hypothetical protein D9758_006280 [Tetrapyrgos nigripes]|uniref:Uncharacterized protein n=1 Tax=Tetrapyrgos nigripes TaxID=182062 RepID=A0A8H5G024_9AGAR|nr:hypothetical protein D9758_006280 [Tetrapyrgos nigripes]